MKIFVAFLLAFSCIGCDKAVDALKDDPEVIFKNDSNETIGNVFKRDCGTTSWRRMGGDIDPASEKMFELDHGCYDFRAEMVTGQELLWEDTEMEKGQVITLTVYTDY
jgi:hypothetical protein